MKVRKILVNGFKVQLDSKVTKEIDSSVAYMNRRLWIHFLKYTLTFEFKYKYA